MYIVFNKENNKEGLKFKVSDYVKKSKDQNIFAKGYFLKWSDRVFMIKKGKNAMPWTYVICDLNGGKIVGRF